MRDDDIYIVDIDGTLIKYYYDDKKLLADRAMLNKVLGDAKPFPWVLESGIFDNRKKVVFVTGRLEESRQMTHRWMKENLGLVNYELYLVPFTTADAYVSNKVKKVVEIMRSMDKNPCRVSKFVIIEDDVRILDGLKKVRTECGSGMEMWLVDKEGTRSPYP